MKKTYIEPKNTVVKLNLEKMIADSAKSPSVKNDVYAGRTYDGEKYVLDEMQSRESVSAPDPWDEW